MLNGDRFGECNSGKEIPIVDTKQGVFKEMDELWMSLQGENAPFWTHEYNKHGYCYVNRYKLNGPEDYFRKNIELYRTYDLANAMKRAGVKASDGVEQR